MRGWWGLAVAAIVAVLMIQAAAGAGMAQTSSCAATPRATGPPTPYLAKLSRSWWVENRVWMGVAGAFHGEGFQALSNGQKIGWYRGRPGRLRLYAKRLDGPAADFTNTVPEGYGRTGFQASGLTFGAAGCWALTAIVGKQRSRFVVEVAPAPPG